MLLHQQRLRSLWDGFHTPDEVDSDRVGASTLRGVLEASTIWVS
jgi:hypothetical protein